MPTDHNIDNVFNDLLIVHIITVCNTVGTLFGWRLFGVAAGKYLGYSIFRVLV